MLRAGFLIPQSGTKLAIDEVCMNMASAAMTVLHQAARPVGLMLYTKPDAEWEANLKRIESGEINP